MRILFTIPHYYNLASRENMAINAANRQNEVNFKIKAVFSCLTGLQKLFGKTQYKTNLELRKTDGYANKCEQNQLDIIVCTTRKAHLLNKLPLPNSYFQHCETEAEPKLLGYACQQVLKENLGKYDYYCYLEDDLLIHEPLFFEKLAWFNHFFGNNVLLQPNRYEVSIDGPVCKAYIDGNLPLAMTATYQDIKVRPELKATVLNREYYFTRTTNPHAGCYFLNQAQLEHWSSQKYFDEKRTDFAGPLESAATIGIMRIFDVYKPVMDNASFLELQHLGFNYLQVLGLYKYYDFK